MKMAVEKWPFGREEDIAEVVQRSIVIIECGAYCLSEE